MSSSIISSVAHNIFHLNPASFKNSVPLVETFPPAAGRPAVRKKEWKKERKLVLCDVIVKLLLDFCTLGLNVGAPCGGEQRENARMRERLRKFLWIWFEKLDFLDVECFCLFSFFLSYFPPGLKGALVEVAHKHSSSCQTTLLVLFFYPQTLSWPQSPPGGALPPPVLSSSAELPSVRVVAPWWRRQGRWCYWSPTSELTNGTFFKQGFSWVWLFLRFLKAELHSVYFHVSRGRCFLNRHDGKMTVYLEGLWGFCLLVFLSVVCALQLLLQDQMHFLDVEEPATVLLQNQNRTRPEGPRLPGCLPTCFYLFKAFVYWRMCEDGTGGCSCVSRNWSLYKVYVYIHSINIYIYKKYIYKYNLDLF